MTRGGWKDEDLHFRLVDSPPSYAYTTDGPVRYAVVANDNGVLGYLWASDEDDAAGFEPRRSAGDDPFNAAVAWVQNLRPLKAADLRPTQALARLATAPGDPVTGRVVPGSEGTAPSLAILKELAAD